MQANVVGEIGDVHTKQGHSLKEPFRCDGNLCAATDNVSSSIQHEKGPYTEHICYDCWPTKNGFQVLKVSCKLKKVRASGGT